MACSHFRAIVLSSDVRNDSRKAMWATLTLPVLISIPEVWGRAMALPLLAIAGLMEECDPASATGQCPGL